MADFDDYDYAHDVSFDVRSPSSSALGARAI